MSDDLRSNALVKVLEPTKLELTDIEKEECIKAAKSVDGDLVGVDLLPSKNRETEQPYILRSKWNVTGTGVYK